MSDHESPNHENKEQGKAEVFGQLADNKEPTLLQEFAIFLRSNKKWWLVPLLLALFVYGTLLILSLTGGIASLYTLF